MACDLTSDLNYLVSFNICLSYLLYNCISYNTQWALQWVVQVCHNIIINCCGVSIFNRPTESGAGRDVKIAYWGVPVTVRVCHLLQKNSANSYQHLLRLMYLAMCGARPINVLKLSAQDWMKAFDLCLCAGDKYKFSIQLQGLVRSKLFRYYKNILDGQFHSQCKVLRKVIRHWLLNIFKLYRNSKYCCYWQQHFINPTLFKYFWNLRDFHFELSLKVTMSLCLTVSPPHPPHHLI